MLWRNSDNLGEIEYFFLSLDDNDEDVTYAFHCYCCNEAWTWIGAISFKNVEGKVVFGCFICFYKVDKCHIGRSWALF